MDDRVERRLLLVDLGLLVGLAGGLAQDGEVYLFLPIGFLLQGCLVPINAPSESEGLSPPTSHQYNWTQLVKESFKLVTSHLEVLVHISTKTRENIKQVHVWAHF